MYVCMLSHFSCVQLFVTLWTVACQPPLSMGFYRKDYWGGLPCTPPGNLPDPMIEPMSAAVPTLQVDSLLLSHWGSPSRSQWTIFKFLAFSLRLSSTQQLANSSSGCLKPNNQQDGTTAPPESTQDA